MPGKLVLGAQGTLSARVVDNNIKLMQEVMYEVAKHNGTSVVEFLQNCIIFTVTLYFFERKSAGRC